MNTPPILTTTVGSYPVPQWLTNNPSEQALLDATRVVLDIQRQAGIDILKRSVADRKMAALVKGRDLYLRT